MNDQSNQANLLRAKAIYHRKDKVCHRIDPQKQKLQGLIQSLQRQISRPPVLFLKDQLKDKEMKRLRKKPRSI